MKKYLLFLALFGLCFGGVYVPFAGYSSHILHSSYEAHNFVQDDNGDEVIIKHRRPFNSNHSPVGLVYEGDNIGAGFILYQNSYYRESNAFFLTYIQRRGPYCFKLMGGVVNGYKYRIKDRSYSLMAAPAVSRDFGPLSVEAGIVYGAAMVNFRIKLY